MEATSGGMVDPGGGTLEIAVEVAAAPSLVLVPDVSRTSPPMVVMAVPLTDKIPPRGAFGGIVLVLAF